MLTLKNTDIPALLKGLPVPPKQLFIEGDLETLLSRPRLAVVGSRKASPYGRRITDQMVHELAAQGAVIISGLALGIDAVAHQAALQAGGTTIAVLPCGLDHIYPNNHFQLAKQIISSGGVVMTEYPPGTPPLKHHFIARNRLVAGLAQALLVTEAAERSGTLYTANFALEQGKPVLAVPGNVDLPGSVGTNNLLKSGALLATSAQDVFDALGLTLTKARPAPIAMNAEEASILDQLMLGLSDAHDIMSACSLPAAVFNQTLTVLELNGKIKPLGANHWALK